MNKKEFEAFNFKEIDFNKNEQEKERAQEALNNLSEESSPLKTNKLKKDEVLSVLRKKIKKNKIIKLQKKLKKKKLKN